MVVVVVMVGGIGGIGGGFLGDPLLLVQNIQICDHFCSILHKALQINQIIIACALQAAK